MGKRIENGKITIPRALESVGVAIFKLCEKGIDASYENILKELKVDINDRMKANKVHNALIVLLYNFYIEKKDCRTPTSPACYVLKDRHKELIEALIRRVEDLENRRMK